MCKIADIVVLFVLGLCGISDWKKKTIPLIWILLLGAVILISVLICRDVGVRLRVSGGLLGGLFLLISKYTREAIGYGDSLLILLLGIYLGGLRVLEVLFWATTFAAITSVFFLWRRRWKRNATLPFVPFLSIAYLGVILL